MARCCCLNEEQKNKLKREKEEARKANDQQEKMMIREKLTKRYSKAISEIIEAIDKREITQEKKKKKEDDGHVKVKNEIARMICEQALWSLKNKVNKGETEQEYYYDSWRMIYGEVYRVINEVNLCMKSVERIIEDVFNVIGEREMGKERMMEMERVLMRYEEAMDKVVGVVEEREEEKVVVKEKVMVVCEEALGVLFEEVVERSDEFFQVDDEVESELMVYDKAFGAINRVLEEEEEEEEEDIERVRKVFEDVYVVIINGVFEKEKEEEEVKKIQEKEKLLRRRGGEL